MTPDRLGARLGELFGAFTRLGCTAFGGPAVHIALFEREFVVQRNWLSREHFLDLLAVTNLLPGPNSTEMAIHIGYVRAGFLGALVAGCAFIGPSFLMVWALSWGYVTYGQLPQVDPLLSGIAPVVVAIIAEAAWKLGRAAIARPRGQAEALPGLPAAEPPGVQTAEGPMLAETRRIWLGPWRPRKSTPRLSPRFLPPWSYAGREGAGPDAPPLSLPSAIQPGDASAGDPGSQAGGGLDARAVGTRAAPILLLVLAFVAAVSGVHELAVLLAAGLAGLVLSAPARARLAYLLRQLVARGRSQGAWLLWPVTPVAAEWWARLLVDPDLLRLGELAWFFLRTGAVLFGSGYLLISFIERDVVQTYHWLTPRQLLDAIALGQLTPGPLSTTATFVGYLVAGNRGAVVATVAMFLPSFVVVFASSPFVARLRHAVIARAFLDGVNPAVVGLLAATVVRLGTSALVDVPSVLVGLVAFVLLARWQVNSVWLLLLGAIAGLVRFGMMG